MRAGILLPQLNSASSQSLTDAFGGLSAVASYPLHKALEATIIAAVYTVYVGRNSAAAKAIWHLPVLGLLFGLPSVIGSVFGYYISLDTTYFYAFGVTDCSVRSAQIERRRRVWFQG